MVHEENSGTGNGHFLPIHNNQLVIATEPIINVASKDGRTEGGSDLVDRYHAIGATTVSRQCQKAMNPVSEDYGNSAGETESNEVNYCDGRNLQLFLHFPGVRFLLQ